MYAFMDWPLVKITWIDSCEPYVGWQHIQALKQPDSMECISVGFLVDDGERAKTIAPHVTAPITESAQGCGIMVIPTASIVRIDRLSVSELALDA